MDDHRSNSAGRPRPLAAFAAAFAGVFLLGGVVIGVEFLEVHRTPVEMKPVVQAIDSDRVDREANFRVARFRTADARRQADAAENELFQFLNRQFVDASEQAITNLRPEARPEPSQPPEGPTIRPNPEWHELNRELTAMQRQRGELLEKLTPAHPTVQALDSQMTMLRDRIAATPAELPTDPNEAPNEIPVKRPTERNPELSTPAIHSAASPPTVEMQQTYRNLLVAAGRARDNYRSALAAEAAAWNICQHGRLPTIDLDGAVSVDVRSAEPDSQLATSNSRPFPIGAVAILTVLSIFAGVVAARRTGRPVLTFASEEEIEATLGLPVLGRFGSEADRPGKNAA